MAHKIDAHGRIVFKRLDVKEQTITLNYLKGKKLEVSIRNGKIISKSGNKSGKTLYNVSEEVLDAIKSRDEIFLKDFAVLFNKEIGFYGYDSIYGKMIRDQRVLNYLLTLNIINYRVGYRTRLDITAPLVKFTVEKHNYERLLNFFIEYLSCDTIDNTQDLRDLFISRNNQQMIKKLDDFTEKRNKYKTKQPKQKMLKKKVKRSLDPADFK